MDQAGVMTLISVVNEYFCNSSVMPILIWEVK